MKVVYLTSGPRGSGKSTYIKKMAAYYPEVVVISRDDILIELFGSTLVDSYTNGHYKASKIMFERIGEQLSRHEKMAIILDCWNGFSTGRMSIIRKLKEELGVDRVICWQFFVPVDLCVLWSMSKPDSKGRTETGIRHDYALYYKTAEDIEEDGFDGIRYIDPRQLFF